MTVLTLLIGVYIMLPYRGWNHKILKFISPLIHYYLWVFIDSVSIHHFPWNVAPFFTNAYFSDFFQNSLELSVPRFKSSSSAYHQYIFLADCTCLSKDFCVFLITAFSLCLCTSAALC